MKRLVLVLNGKGGVGKSFFAVNLVQFFHDRGIPHVAIDTDNENSTLNRFHPGATFIDLQHSRALDPIGLVVVDGRAASTDLFLDFFEEIDLPTVLDQLGATLTLAIPINHEADSVDQVQRLVDRLGGRVQYLVVRNAVHSTSFALYENLEVRARLQNELGAREIELPRLQDWLVEALNRDNLTVSAACRHPAIHLLDRQRLLHWKRHLYASLESVQHLLLPNQQEVRRA